MKTLPRLSLLTALIAAATFSSGAFAATAGGTASATALTPITIVPAIALSFGSFATSAAATAGTIMLTSAGGGARTQSGGTVLSVGGPGAVGTFTIGGTGNATFAVTYPAGATAFAGTTSGLSAVFGVTAGAGYGVGSAALAAGGTYTLLVGGILTVPAAVVAGSYTASYNVIVEYN